MILLDLHRLRENAGEIVEAMMVWSQALYIDVWCRNAETVIVSTSRATPYMPDVIVTAGSHGSRELGPAGGRLARHLEPTKGGGEVETCSQGR